ncbi:hypothetical protein N7540_003880 [Penicillium herquei]|nr:hypothetical protein N7540_003880 [Penicillium herquei]
MPAADASRILIRKHGKRGRNVPSEGALVLLNIMALGRISQGFLKREAKARHRNHYSDMIGNLKWMRHHGKTILFEWFNETPRRALVYDVAVLCWYQGAHELLADTANIEVIVPELKGSKDLWMRLYQLAVWITTMNFASHMISWSFLGFGNEEGKDAHTLSQDMES